MQKLDKSKLTKSFAKKQKLAPWLDKAFTDFDEPFEFKTEPKVPDDAFHPSGDCTPSAIDLYTRIVEEKPAITPSLSLHKSFMVGHFWHQLLQHIVLNKLEFCSPDAIERRGFRSWDTDIYKPKPYHWATGAGDIAPLILPSGWEGVVDFKTMGSGSFGKKALPFADKYEAQINIYMDFFELDKGLIVGIQKDSPHNFEEFEFERNQELIDVVYDKWEYIGECLTAGALPDDDDAELPLKGPLA